MYNPARPILDMHLQGTANSSEEFELQGVVIWFLINRRVIVLILDHYMMVLTPKIIFIPHKSTRLQKNCRILKRLIDKAKQMRHSHDDYIHFPTSVFFRC